MLKIKKVNFVKLVIIVFTGLISIESRVTAGSGAGWGVAGGLIAGSMIASAANNNRNREVVYVQNGQQKHYSHKQQHRLNQEQAALNQERAELIRERERLNKEKERLNREAARLGY